MVGKKKRAAFQMIFAISDQPFWNVWIMVAEDPGETLDPSGERVHHLKILSANPVACENIVETVTECCNLSRAENIDQMGWAI